MIQFLIIIIMPVSVCYMTQTNNTSCLCYAPSKCTKLSGSSSVKSDIVIQRNIFPCHSDVLNVFLDKFNHYFLKQGAYKIQAMLRHLTEKAIL